MSEPDPRRVVITGLGALAPNGIGRDAFWQACVSGQSGIRQITRFDASFLPTRIAGEVPDFQPGELGLSQAEIKTLDRGTQFAVAAANLALWDSGLLDTSGNLHSQIDRATCGVSMGTAMGPVAEGERLWRQFTDNGTCPPRPTQPASQPAALLLASMPAAAIAAHHELHGPCAVIATGCSAGADAIGQAFWNIHEGRSTHMLAGGCDSSINAPSINVFSVMRALSTNNAAPERASRPYDAQRDGFVMSEGAAVLLLEERASALARGATIYAELLAFVSNNNAHHMTSLPEDGRPLQHLLRLALAEAEITPQHLGYINSHGSSTPSNERAETAAYKAVFGPFAYQIPISATKSLIGHTQGAASALEAVVTALALHHQILPPTINQEQPDPLCDLDYVPNIARPANFSVALTHSSGFGGVNTALILARPEFLANGVPKTPLCSPQPPLHVAPALAPGAPLRRVVVTGMGVVAPTGIGVEAFWQASLQGISGIKPLRRFPTENLPIQVAGEVADFQAEAYLPRKFVQRTDRVTQFTTVAVEEALRNARLDLAREDPARVGAVIANTMGGVEFVLEQIEALYTQSPRAMSAYTAIAWLQVANVGQVALRHNVQGYCKTPVNDLAGGLEALALATRAIQRGAADILITGGSEALLHPCFLLIFGEGDLCAPGDNLHAYRPFDQRASGLLLAEGAGICILEEYEHARQRQAPIYGEILGSGATNDARGSLAPTPSGAHYARAIRLALQDAHLQPDEIDYFSLDGRAHPAADLAEATALRDVFGARLAELPVSVPRTTSGHSYAAAGALDTITTLLALRAQQIPPTLNCEQPDPRHQLNLVREQARPFAGSTALLGARGVSGTNLVLAVRGGEEGLLPPTYKLLDRSFPRPFGEEVL